MQIPKELITNNIKNAPYYNTYLEMVTKHDKKIAAEEGRQTKVLPPKTAEKILARERERKARTTSLMAIPKDHLTKFHKISDAKGMWEAIKSRFGGNDESKKMQKYILKQQLKRFSVSNSEGLHKGYDRFQSLLSQLEIHSAGVSTKDANQKFLRSLPASWSQVSLIMRTKPGVDTLSFDDLYNNLRVFESDVKGFTASSSSTQNVAFVSSESTSSTNEANTAYGVSTSSSHNLQRKGSSSYSDELIQGISLESADQKGIKILGGEMHGILGIKQKTMGGDLEKKKEPKALVILDGDGVDWIGHSEDEQENFALMAYSKSGSDTEREQLGDASIQAYDQALKKMSAKDKSRLENGNQIHKGILSYETEVFKSVFDSRSSDIEDSSVNDRYAEGMHAIPPPMTGIYMPSKSDFRIDESMFTYGPKQSKTSKSDAETSNSASCESNFTVETLEFIPKPVANKPKAVSEPKVWSDASIIEEYESDSDDKHVTIPSKEQEKPSFTYVNTIKHVKTTKQTVE
nr:ribonuclease H-like domain-containing protein [Tanacetum cinerariifolium]